MSLPTENVAGWRVCRVNVAGYLNRPRPTSVCLSPYPWLPRLTRIPPQKSTAPPGLLRPHGALEQEQGYGEGGLTRSVSLPTELFADWRHEQSVNVAG